MGRRDSCCVVHGRHALPLVPLVQLLERCDSDAIPSLEVSAVHCVARHAAASPTLAIIILFARFSLALIPKCRKLLRSAFIGFVCTGLGDVVSNTFKVRASTPPLLCFAFAHLSSHPRCCVLHSPIYYQVVKTLRQTRTKRLSYTELIRREVHKDGWFWFLTRGLKTKCPVLLAALLPARNHVVNSFFVDCVCVYSRHSNCCV